MLNFVKSNTAQFTGNWAHLINRKTQATAKSVISFWNEHVYSNYKGHVLVFTLDIFFERIITLNQPSVWGGCTLPTHALLSITLSS